MMQIEEPRNSMRRLILLLMCLIVFHKYGHSQDLLIDSLNILEEKAGKIYFNFLSASVDSSEYDKLSELSSILSNSDFFNKTVVLTPLLCVEEMETDKFVCLERCQNIIDLLRKNDGLRHVYFQISYDGVLGEIENCGHFWVSIRIHN